MEHRMAGVAERHLVLHYQLLGNAGDVINRILDKNFGDALVYLNSDSHNSTLHNRDLLTFLRDQPGVKAVSSYHLRPPKPETEGFVFFDILLIRHPLDRIYAMFERQARKSGSLGSTPEAAGGCDLHDFVRKLMIESPHCINDAQVNFLSNGGRYYRPPDESDLYRAAQIVREAALPGLAELFALSLTTAEYYWRPAFGNLDLSYVTPRPCSFGEGRQQRVDKLRDLCGALTYEQLLEMNRLDLQLMEITEAEIRRRYQLIPNHDQRLLEFVGRCQQAAEFFLEHDEVDGP